MNRRRLILRSLVHHGRADLGVALGVALTAGILTGALVVGDSVRATLHALARARLGDIEQALVAAEGTVRAALADDLARGLAAPVAPVLLLDGAARRPDGSAQANGVQVVGADPRFWSLGGATNPLADAAADEVAINARLAEQLRLQAGDRLMVRIEKPPLISRDAPLSGRSDATVALPVRVRCVVSDRAFGRFSLRANQIAPATVFLSLAALQAHTEQPDRANVLLVASGAPAGLTLSTAWKLADAGLELRTLFDGQTAELRSGRVFLPPAAASAALALRTNAAGALTYFVNELRLGDRATPYSFVTGTGAALRDGEVIINQWLADDLHARPGDELALRYFVMGERRTLSETTTMLRVQAVVPTAADASWMPAFPGLADAENCGDWEPGLPIDLQRIRPMDEQYWDTYRGTPKAFVSLATAQRLWTNRFGALTAIRFPGAGGDLVGLERALLERMDPAALGLAFSPVRALAMRAGGQAMDFGGLFIGFSFFLIAAALLLTALLFAFLLENRQAEIGLLQALGFRAGQVRALLLGEAAVLALAGGVIGVPAGLLYARLALVGLSTVWRGAVGAVTFDAHLAPATLIAGALAGALTAGATLWIVLQRQFRRTPAERLARADGGARARGGLLIGGVGLVAALALMVVAGGPTGRKAAEVFFGAGACLLLAGLGFCHAWLARLARVTAPAATLAALGLRHAARRRGRSLAAIGLLAAGVFLFVAVSAFVQDPQRAAGERSSGTGGFALFAQSTLPLYDDLDRADARAALGLDEAVWAGVSVVPLRVRAGDEASCLNLNRAQQVPVWGVRPADLASRGAFTFASAGGGWERLDAAAPDDAVPAIGDVQTVTWALGKKVGDEVALTDDHGRPLRLRIVGLVAPSLLQGGLLIAERAFTAHFPAAGGYRMFLLDALPARADAVAAELTRALEDRGLEVRPAWQRLADFAEVSNTYLRIFQALAGLGLLLGSLGFGLVVLRNLLERRRELAVLQAVGFCRADLLRVALREHLHLIGLGLAVGVGSALVAILPALLTPGPALPLRGFALALGGLAVSGLLASWLAARAAVHGDLVPALRSE
jgi:putative ABC transport system permease protein